MEEYNGRKEIDRQRKHYQGFSNDIFTPGTPEYIATSKFRVRDQVAPRVRHMPRLRVAHCCRPRRQPSPLRHTLSRPAAPARWLSLSAFAFESATRALNIHSPYRSHRPYF